MKTLFPILLAITPTLTMANPDLPDASILTREYLAQMTGRARGQTSFVVKNQVWNPRQQQQQQGQQQEQQQDGGNRSIQESDVYKIGNPLKKELFLLNNYRGFQVVSFEDGLAKPKLISRLPIYNNWGSEMYYLAGQEKVLIINTEYNYVANDWSVNYNTKVYLVDVNNSNEPKVVNELSLPGYLQESRMVGDVLYTITHNGSADKKVKITSIKLGYGDMETIDEAELHSDDKYVQTMNVVKENNRYYVISTLSNWNATGDLINVHDITSPNGKIKKLFSASVRGRILERSQTFMHKGHLFAVSNYTENNAPMRVSVEAFPMKASSSIVSSKPNMRISVGDTTGLNANLQDVRVSGDHLYAFWVPANNMDPFELFDISNPQKGIKHLGQLQFDGWISKAFPLMHEGKNYVLGLGWVAPATNENGRRLPQAKLFQIKEENGNVRHEVVSSLTIASEEIWTSFNDEDKYFEVMNDGPGKFNILFPVTFSKNWKGGAKVVTADLNTNELKEGASVQGEQGWLKRIFTNKDMSALHAFSNERLENFSNAKLTEPGLAKTVSVLELARNILSFHPVDNSHGIQVVSQDDSMEVRSVPLSNADAEKTEIQSLKTIPGTHAWHKVKNNKLYAVTTFYTPRNESDYYWNRKFTHANLNVLDLSTNVLTSNKIDLNIGDNQYYYLNLRNVSSDNEELFIIGEEFFRLQTDKLEKFTITKDCEYFFKNEEGNLSLQSFGKDILAFNSFKLKIDDTADEKFAYYMPFFKVLDFNQDEVSCSKSINVPGKPVMVDGDFMVASEDLDDWYDYEYYGQQEFKHSYMPRRYRSSSKTVALKLEDKAARLTDYLKRNIAGSVFKKGFVTYDSEEKLLELWSLDEDGEFMSKPLFMDYGNGGNLVTIKTFNARSFIFMQDQKTMDVLEVTGGKKIRPLSVISEFEQSPFSIEDISASPDLKTFYLSQGMYGISELKVK
jgi:hypothetical protein